MQIAVLADDPVLDYYLFQVKKLPYILKNNTILGFASFLEGFEVVSGLYCNKRGDSPFSYSLIKEKQAIVPACSVHMRRCTCRGLYEHIRECLFGNSVKCNYMWVRTSV